MADRTGIVWTDSTWNPLRGCSRVSDGCRHCYAERVAARFSGSGQPYEGLAKSVTRPDGRREARWTGKVELVEHMIEQPLRWRRPRRIFVNSMSDLFHESVPDEWIDRVFAVMALAPQHCFQVLTKRPERMRNYCSDPSTPGRVARAADAITALTGLGPEEMRPVDGYPCYLVSSHGHVYSEKRGRRRRMSPDAGEQGHLRVQLHREGCGPRGDRLLVHRLVLETFDGPPPSPDAQGRHRDGNPGNNAITNLSWGDQSKNWDDRKRHGRHRSYSKLDEATVTAIKSRLAAGDLAEHLGPIFGVSATQIRNIAAGRQWATAAGVPWPLANCWLGVSVEDQATADERIPILLDTPAAVRWISAEPLLGPVDISEWLFGLPEPCAGCPKAEDCDCMWRTRRELGLPSIDWVVPGGESGPGARSCDIGWIRSLQYQCHGADVPVLIKQLGAAPYDTVFDLSLEDNRPVPLRLRDPKGGDMAEWPDDLRIREYPNG